MFGAAVKIYSTQAKAMSILAYASCMFLSSLGIYNLSRAFAARPWNLRQMTAANLHNSPCAKAKSLWMAQYGNLKADLHDQPQRGAADLDPADVNKILLHDRLFVIGRRSPAEQEVVGSLQARKRLYQSRFYPVSTRRHSGLARLMVALRIGGTPPLREARCSGSCQDARPLTAPETAF